MAIEKGSAFLLKVGDGADPIVYTTIAGLRTTQMSINAETVVVTNKGSGGWRELLSGAGVDASGGGEFTAPAKVDVFAEIAQQKVEAEGEAGRAVQQAIAEAQQMEAGRQRRLSTAAQAPALETGQSPAEPPVAEAAADDPVPPAPATDEAAPPQEHPATQ